MATTVILVFHPDWNFDWVDLMQKTAMLEFLSIMALSCPEDTVSFLVVIYQLWLLQAFTPVP